MVQLLGLFLLTLLASCTNIEQLKRIGRAPELAKLDLPQNQPDYQPVTPPAPANEPYQQQEEEADIIYQRASNSLWRPGRQTFFRDQRARRVGDILNVKITVDDSAKIHSEYEQGRDSNSETLHVNKLAGLEQKFSKFLPNEADPANLLNTSSSTKRTGKGDINRSETVTTEIAATITQILPSGNLVIQGKQEIKVNNEVREISVGGIVKPQDIDINNTVTSDQIAEARISYGGRGIINNVQQPRVGHQVIEAISPF